MDNKPTDAYPKKIVSIGATSKIAIEMQRIWAKNGYSIFLSSRKPEDLENIKKDLLIRGASHVEIKDLSKIEDILDFDVCLISIGNLSEQKRWENEKSYRVAEWKVNTELPISYIEWATYSIEQSKRGQICVITSVAADRAKKSNYAYGAAKASLDFYLQGVDHRLSSQGLTKRICTLKPGPTLSPMTADMEGKKLADPKDVAKEFCNAIKKGKSSCYAPWIWRYIMLIIKHIPSKIWFKTNF
jgi:short-subunit dehydrogenase